MPNVNILAVVVAAVLSMVIGFVWYSPSLFGNMWMKLTGRKKGDSSMNDTSTSYLITTVGALISAYVMALFVGYLNVTSLTNGLGLGFVAWLGFVFTTFLSNGMFEGKNLKLIFLNSGYYLANFLVIAGLLAIWR